MADLSDDLAVLTDAFVRPLIDEPDAQDITAAKPEAGNLMMEKLLADYEAGQVIGRQGRIAKEIRTVVRSYAQRSGAMVSVDIVD